MKLIVSDNGCFVDKTLLIKEFLENSSYILLMPRPNRFGKTLNLSMIEHFFDIQKIKSIEQQKANEDDTKFHSRVNNEIEKALNQIERNNF